MFVTQFVYCGRTAHSARKRPETIVLWCAQYIAAEQTDQLPTPPLHDTDKGEQCEYGAVSGGEVHITQTVDHDRSTTILSYQELGQIDC